MKKGILAALLAVTMIWSAASAQASSVVIKDKQDFFVGTDYSAVGNFKQVGESTLNLNLLGSVAGMTSATFDYSFSGVLPLMGSTIAQADQIFAFSFFGMNAGSSEKTQLVGSQDNLVISAVWDAAKNAGSIVISNLGQAAVDIGLQIQATVLSLTGGKGTFLLNSKTAGLQSSEVPLPAALPLFGLGLAGLAALGVRKKKDAA